MKAAHALGLAFFALSTPANAVTFYIAPNGNDTTGSGTYASPWATAANAYQHMHSGDWLELKNGTYKGMVLLGRWVLPPNGTSAKYTTVIGESYGGVVIDGLGDDNNGSTAGPISIDGPPAHVPQYIQFANVIAVHQAQCGIVDGNHLKFIRMGFQGAGDGNTASFSVQDNAHHILVQDCFAWGDGRMKFIAYLASNIIFRRCVARVDNVTIPEPDDELSAFSIYSCTNVEMQNDIVVDSDHPEFWRGASYFGGAFHVPTTAGPSTNVAWRGCIAYNLAMGLGVLADNNTEVNTTYTNCVGLKLGGGIWDRAGDVHYSHCTFDNWTGSYTNFPAGATFYPQNDLTNTSSIKDSVLTDINGAAIESFASEDYNAFYTNQSDLSNTPAGAHSVHGTNPSLLYPLRIETTNALLHGTASDGGDRGANVLYQYGADGSLYGDPGYATLTTKSLWPWVGEAVIKRFMASYSYHGLKADGTIGTLYGNRGFAASGTGLYGGPITLTSYLWESLGHPSPWH